MSRNRLKRSTSVNLGFRPGLRTIEKQTTADKASASPIERSGGAGLAQDAHHGPDPNAGGAGDVVDLALEAKLAEPFARGYEHRLPVPAGIRTEGGLPIGGCQLS